MSSENSLRRRHEQSNGAAPKVEAIQCSAKQKKDVKRTSAFQWLKRNPTTVLLSTAYLAVGLFWAYGKYLKTHPALPDTYILCTGRNQQIYTVDENSSKVQCIGVEGSLIFDRGLLGASSRVFVPTTTNP
jgi:hypothetical protein